MTQNLMERMLSRLPQAVWDKDAEPELAMRIRHPDGFKWKVVSNDILVTVGDEDPVTYSLLDKTMDGLAELLQSRGCDIVYQNPALAGVGARALVFGSGDQFQSNGDHLSAYRALLWSMLGGYEVELNAAAQQVIEALRQMVMLTAEGFWLEVWGTIFGFPREGSETDPDYRERIIAETLRPRSNPLAISQTIQALTGHYVKVREPWKEMFILGESPMDGDFHFQDGNFFTRNVIQPVTTSPIDFTRTLQIIERNKPAGTIVANPQVEFDTRFCAFGDGLGEVASDRHDTSTHYGNGRTPALSTFMTLSGYEVTNNWAMTLYTIIGRYVPEALNYTQVMLPPRTVAKAAICLSDGNRLGDLNGVLGYGQRDYILGSELLSGSESMGGLQLSDVQRDVIERRFDEIIEHTDRKNAVLTPSPTVTGTSSWFSMRYVSYPVIRMSEELLLSDLIRDYANYGGRVEGRSASANGAGVIRVLAKDVRVDTYGLRVSSGISADQDSAGFSIVKASWATRLGDAAYWAGLWSTPERIWSAEPRYLFGTGSPVPDSYVAIVPVATYVELIASHQDVLRASLVQSSDRASMAIKYPDAVLGGMALSDHEIDLIDIGARTDVAGRNLQFDLMADQSIDHYRSVYRASVSLSDGVPMGEPDARFDYPDGVDPA